MKRAALPTRKLAEIESMIADAYARGEGFGLHLELALAVSAFERQQGREAPGLRQMVEGLTHQRVLRAPEVVREMLASIREREATGEMPEGSAKVAARFASKEFLEAWTGDAIPELADDHAAAVQEVADRKNGAENRGRVGEALSDTRALVIAVVQFLTSNGGNKAKAGARRFVSNTTGIPHDTLTRWENEWLWHSDRRGVRSPLERVRGHRQKLEKLAAEGHEMESIAAAALSSISSE